MKEVRESNHGVNNSLGPEEQIKHRLHSGKYRRMIRNGRTLGWAHSDLSWHLDQNRRGGGGGGVGIYVDLRTRDKIER